MPKEHVTENRSMVWHWSWGIYRSNRGIIVMSCILPLRLLSTILSIYVPLLMGQFISDAAHLNLHLLIQFAIYGAISIIADQMFNIGAIWLRAHWNVSARISLTEKILSGVTDGALSSSGEIISRLNTDVHKVINGLFGMFVTNLTAGATLLLILLVSAGVNRFIALLLGIWITINFCFTLLFRRPLQNMQQKTRETSAQTMEWSTHLFQMPQGLMAVGQLAIQWAVGKSGVIWGRYAKSSARESAVTSVFSNLQELMRLAVIIMLVSIAAWSGNHHMIPLGYVIGFIILINRVSGPVETLATLPVGIAQMHVSADRLLPYLSQSRVRLPVAAESSDSAVKAQSLRIEAGGKTLLKSLNLDIPEKGIFIIIGANGAGKSLLVQTLLGLRPPADGLVNWHAVNSLDQIGYVPQFIPIYPTTIFDNVALGRNLSEEDVEQVLKLVGLSTWRDLHSLLPSTNLSGGERKRIGLARALVTRPGVIVCDELEAGVDNPESLIDFVQSSAKLVLAVSHHRGLWSRCEGIIMIRNGQAEVVNIFPANQPASERSISSL